MLFAAIAFWMRFARSAGVSADAGTASRTRTGTTRACRIIGFSCSPGRTAGRSCSHGVDGRRAPVVACAIRIWPARRQRRSLMAENDPKDASRRDFLRTATGALLAAPLVARTAAAQVPNIPLPELPGEKVGWAIVGLGSLAINQI